ncbi:MAG: hypothetical protein HRT61_19570 [Ekhidna sp.]|nr:hypothetical protein [Ekhidna sp.]
MPQEPQYTIYSFRDVQDYLLTPKTLSLNSQWKYKRLWFRRFYNDEIDFSLLVEQSDIGYCFLFGKSDEFTQELYSRGVKQRKEYKILEVEGDVTDVHGRLHRLEKDFTLEVRKDMDGSFRIKMYPSPYEGMNQKRCLIRCSFARDPLEVMHQPIEKVYEGPKETAPEPYHYLFEEPKKAGCIGVLALGISVAIVTCLWLIL